MKKRNKIAAAILAAVMTTGIGVAIAAPAEAATANRYVNCGSRYAALRTTNLSSSWMSVTLYNASTGAYVNQISIAPYATRDWLPAIHNARFFLNGPAFTTSQWCS